MIPTKMRKRQLKFYLLFMLIMTTSCNNYGTAAEWAAYKDDPTAVGCPDFLGSWTLCLARNSFEEKNIPKICEGLYVINGTVTERMGSMCSNLNKCKAPAVLKVIRANTSSSISKSHYFSCTLFDPSVLTPDDEVTYAVGCRYTDAGVEYYGNASTTTSGKTCERWDAGLPHFEPLNLTFFSEPVTNLAQLGNKCRNYFDKDTKLAKKSTPWCQTNTGWELCNIPYCSDRATIRTCRLRTHGTDYNGVIAVSEFGRTCLAWSTFSSMFVDNMFPDGTVAAAGNKCRNPIGNPKPFCITWQMINGVSTPGRDWCTVPYC